MKLSKNFTLKEFTKSSTADRLGVPNIPTKKEIENLKHFANAVAQPLRDSLGRINVNSGFRSEALNNALGSSNRSYHRFGAAGDLEADSDDVSNLDLLVYAYNNLEFDELIAEYFNKDDSEAGWVHIAKLPNSNKRILKLKDKEHNYQEVSIEYIISLYS